MKNKKQLTREQRYETEALLRAGKRQKETAEPVEKDQSVISRELKRNSHKRGYSARLGAGIRR
jgi:IS30 family transposase